ncbi:MAG: exopolysaccharide transport family protein [Beijerinckiaceae bacterium]
MSIMAIERASPGMSSEVDLAGLKHALSNRRWWVIGPAIAAFVLAAIGVNIVKPRYTAETRLLLENQESYFTRPEKQTAEQIPVPDAEAVQSQIQLITSRDLARKAIRAIGLQGNPEFDPIANGVGALSRLLILLGLQKDPTLLSPEERIMERYFDRLAVYSPTKTRILSIEFQSQDPDLSARAANTIADLYLDLQAGAKRDTARVAATALGAQITDLKARLAQAEARAEAFRAKSGLYIGVNNTPISTQQLAEINTQLSNARTAQADAQAKAKLIRDMIRQGRISDVPDVANNELIRRISEQRVNLRAQLAFESRTLLSGHPRMKELHAQMADLESELRKAAEKTVRTLENEANIAGGRVENLTQVMEQQKKVAGSQSADEVQLRDYERTVRLLRDQVESDATKYQEALARESGKAAPADARIVSRAVAPQMPTFPKKVPITAFATLAAIVLSIGLVLASELLSGRGYVRGAVPVSVRRATDADIRPAEIVAAAPIAAPPAPPAHHALTETSRDREGRAFAEPLPATEAAAAQTMTPDVVARLIDTHEPGRAVRVLVTSPPDEANAPDVAIETARALSERGRAIVIALSPLLNGFDELVNRASDEADPDRGQDGDRPHLGLTDLLAGEASFAEAIHRDGSSGIHFIPVGRAPDGGFEGIDLVLDALSHTYDFVVLSAVRADEQSEALALASQVDAVMLATSGSSSDEATKTYADLIDAGARDVLIVARNWSAEKTAA